LMMESVTGEMRRRNRLAGLSTVSKSEGA
jgi:hypothetical protein